ncbi:S-layer homology domain-containing protein, partial [Paenibacillus luteus]|uniref:S-layer homology domain-containing protein n=1 Tax=Paenibacillus luteus TaxID=2545753 RepID=UPI001142C3B0
PNTLAATSNENGTLYLVLKSATITNKASLDAEVSGSRGTSVAATAASAAAIPTTGLTAGTYVVYAVDAAGNVSTASADVTLTNPDITAPTLSGVGTSVLTPNTLAATSNENGTLYLVLKSAVITNKASLDAEVSGSRGTSVAATAASAAAIPTTGLTAGTYVVYAVDVAGNVSMSSADVTLTNPDVTAPTLSGVGTSVLTPDTLAATSNESGTLYLVLKSAVITNKVSLDAEVIGSRGTSVAATAASVAAIPTTGLTAGTYVVYAVDAAGNVSTASADVTLTNPDVTAPTLSGVGTSVLTPNTLAATSNENGTLYLVLKSAVITNKASLDAEVSGSRGTSVAATAASAAAIPTTGLTAGTYVVYAVDVAGNVSMSSADVTLTNPDITAPTLSLTSASATTQSTTTLNFVSDEAGTYYFLVYAAADAAPNVASITAQGISLAKGTAPAVAASNTASVTGLLASTLYKAYVIVKDASGNASDVATISVTTMALPSNNNISLPDTRTDIMINGKVEKAGTATITQLNGQTVTTVVIDSKKLDEKLAVEGEHATITIPVNTKSDVVFVEFDGLIVKSMEQKQAIIAIKTENATYTLPAQQINISSIWNRLDKNVFLQDIKLQIGISKPTTDIVKLVENLAVRSGFTAVVPPLDFTIKAKYGDKIIEVNKFSAYVERTFAIPVGVDANKITTGIVIDPDGTVRHVPTRIVVSDGNYYAKVNSFTNSTYSIIWNPIEFKDVAQHWAKNAVNDMGSRMVISGVGNELYKPDQDITRAEFAAVIVRGLGLKLENGTGPFKDVLTTDWYSSAVQTAYTYKLINGFEDGNFHPADKITREQAMTIISKAMKLTGLEVNVGGLQTSGELLSRFTDASSVSEWAESSIIDSLQAEIITGRSSTQLAPKAYISRAEVATLVQKLLKKSGLI